MPEPMSRNAGNFPGLNRAARPAALLLAALCVRARKNMPCSLEWGRIA